jgi:low affinity Fe/Cu permease
LNLNEFISGISYKPLTIIIMLSGLGIGIAAFVDFPFQFQVFLVLVGLVFITLGILLLKQSWERKRIEEKVDALMAKIDEVLQEAKKEEPSKGTGVVIADVLSSGLKYYSEHIAGQKKKDQA